MIPNLASITVDGVAYLALSGALVVLAWSRYRAWFLAALGMTGAVMALSWLRPIDLAALAAFLAVPYFAAGALWGRKDVKSGWAVAAVVVFQLVLFLIIKRYAWFDVLGAIDHPVTVVGISYVLFRQIHLVVDAPYVGDEPFGAVRYLAFMLGPWTLAAGPIQRYESFCQGLSGIGRPEPAVVLQAGHRIVNGLIKAFLVAPVFEEPSHIGLLAHPDAGWADFAIVLYGFPIYLYLNFSGYTDIMIGAARMCGFETLPENFNRPYIARNVRDFWSRWHISFSDWVKHYVFTPLSTRLIGSTDPRWHRLMIAIGVMVAFYVVGAWHGTTVNFVVFGLIQGCGVLASASFERWLKARLGRARHRELHDNGLFHATSIVVTFHFTCLTVMLLNGAPGEILEALSAFMARQDLV